MTTKKKEIALTGFPICSGIAIGKPFFFNLLDEVVPEFSIASGEIDDEVRRYRRAIEQSLQDVIRLKKQLEAEGVIEGTAILDAHVHMLQDPLITTQIEDRIREKKLNAECVFQYEINEYEKKFNKISDQFFRERFKDIQDISRRILGYLRRSVRVSLADIPKNAIIFARDLVPSDTAEAKSSRVGAFVTEGGGETSHTAILARAKGIPYVANVDFEALEKLEKSFVIVDGREGKVILNPSRETLTEYQNLQKRLQGHWKEIAKVGALASETIDGYVVKLSANIEMVEELDLLHRYKGCGVGLFRSEYLFLSQGGFPDEEKQFEVYCRILKLLKNLPIVIRTFDVGGDKFNELTSAPEENNPFLGCRAIRFMLRQRELFKSQLRALYRASAYGDVRILFPMISGLPELLEVKAIVNEVKDDLRAHGEFFSDHVKLGCMIEVPSAAMTCDVLAKECDFLSIGTNDLVQYTLAVDRGNQAMSYLYEPTHPSVIRLMKMTIVEGHRQGIPISVCGEIAADPRFTPLLLGLGVQELSVASRYIPTIRQAIRRISIVEATQLADHVLTLPTAEVISDCLSAYYHELNTGFDCVAAK